MLKSYIKAFTQLIQRRIRIPRSLLRRIKKKVKTLRLRHFPIVFTDREIFLDILASSDCPHGLRLLVTKDISSKTWEAYRHLRQQRLVSPSENLMELLQFLKESCPDELQKILRKADDYSVDIFFPFDFQPARLNNDFTWTTFPARNNDVMFIWEINSLQHFTVLAQAFIFTHEAKYLAAIERHLQSWTQENPIDNSINWICVMEVSLRLYALIWTHKMLCQDEGAKEIFPLLTRTIYAHARHVARYMDRPRIKNNHGIFDAIGLYFFSITFPEYALSDRWKAYAEERILDELHLQFTPDGIHKEFSPAYQLVLTELYLHYLVSKTKLQEPVPEDVLTKIRHQVYALSDLSGPDGCIALIGDSSDHRFLRLSERKYSETTSVLYLGSLLFGIKEFFTATPTGIWDAIWLLRKKRYEQLTQSLQATNCTARNQPNLKVYQNEGIFRIQSQNIVLLGHFSSFPQEEHFAGHRHCDISSFLLWKDGSSMVIDPGTFTYRRSLKTDNLVWRDFLRSAAAHNTTTVDGHSQAVPKDEFGFLNKVSAQIFFAEAQKDFFLVAGQHNAYADRSGPSFRIFVLLGQTLLLIDWFPESIGLHSYETNLLFGPSVTEVQLKNLLIHGAAIQWASIGYHESQILKGSYDPPGGWHSSSYGTIQETCQFRTQWSIEGPAVCALLFDLSGTDSISTNCISLNLIPLDKECFAIEASTPQNTFITLLNPLSLITSVNFKELSSYAAVTAFEMSETKRTIQVDRLA